MDSVRQDDHSILPLREGLLLDLRVELVAPPGKAEEQHCCSGVVRCRAWYFGVDVSVPRFLVILTLGPCLQEGERFSRGPPAQATHLRRQLLPERPLMCKAICDQFLAPNSAMHLRSRSSSCTQARAFISSAPPDLHSTSAEKAVLALPTARSGSRRAELC
jgi:hypothetical protein